MMTGPEFREARHALSVALGLVSPMSLSDMGRLLDLASKDKGGAVRDIERNRGPVSGPMEIAVRAMLNGYRPPWIGDVFEGLEPTP